MTEPQGWQPSDEVVARVAVEQVDRDAYADEVERLGDKEYADRVRAGQCDTLSMLHMLARHRITAMQSGWQPIESAPNYLIWSNEHRCWWATDRMGYTLSVERAGRYSRAEAIRIAGTARGGWETGRNPDEIAIPEADALEQALHPDRLEVWRTNKGEPPRRGGVGG